MHLLAYILARASSAAIGIAAALGIWWAVMVKILPAFGL